MRPPRPRTVAAILWTLFIFVLCWTPRQMVPEGDESSRTFLIPYLDKIVHFTMFAGFSFFWLLAGVRRVWWLVVAGIIAAVVSEVGQANSIVRRDANWPDGFADTLGLFGGIIAFYASQRFSATPRRDQSSIR